MQKKSGKEKLLKAVDGYRYATKEDLDDFNKEMKKFNKELVVVDGFLMTYQKGEL